MIPLFSNYVERTIISNLLLICPERDECNSCHDCGEDYELLICPERDECDSYHDCDGEENNK